MHSTTTSTPPVRPRSILRRGVFILGALLMLATVTVMTDSSASAGMCPAEFDRCDGTGDNDGCDHGGIGGIDGLLSSCDCGTWCDVGGGGDGPEPGHWVDRNRNFASFREWTRTTRTLPYEACNTGYQSAEPVDVIIRTLIEGHYTRDLQHSVVCTRVPSQDYCTRWGCYAFKPYAWDVRNLWKWQQYVD